MTKIFYVSLFYGLSFRNVMFNYMNGREFCVLTCTPHKGPLSRKMNFTDMNKEGHLIVHITLREVL